MCLVQTAIFSSVVYQFPSYLKPRAGIQNLFIYKVLYIIVLSSQHYCIRVPEKSTEYRDFSTK